VAPPDRPPGRDVRSGPRETSGAASEPQTSPRSQAPTGIVGQAGDSGGPVCWRCGAPLSAGDDVTLALCTALARGAVEERTAAGLCAGCAAAVAP
jgi:hypothetical protein